MAKTLKDLPHELMVEIFSRMPAKSVGRCRCLSKTWRYNLSTPQFIKLHLTRKTNQQQQNLIFISHYNSLHTITPPIQNNNNISKKLELENTFTQVVGSCNGLVLLTNEKMDLCLINPLTKEKVNIPKFDLALEVYRFHGFGYDSCSDDYKIVAIPNYDVSSVMKPCDKFVDVYSVRRCVWNRVNCYAADIYANIGCKGVALLNGAIHFLAKNGDNKTIIAAFDLANEVFYEIPSPALVFYEILSPAFINWTFYELCVLGERLCLVDVLCNGGNRTDVWTMEEYGSVKSWTKLCSIDETDEYVEIGKPLCFVGDNEIVFLTNYWESWIVYNVKEGTVKRLVVDGLPSDFMSGDICFDSLVSLG